jgi:hypothetical protein
VTSTDYIIDVLLLALVLRQIVPRTLTERSVILPAVLLAIAGEQYLKGFPTAGNDLAMSLVLIVVVLAFGVVSGVTTRVWKQDSEWVVCQAGVAAATAWILGMGIRLGFDVWAHTSSGGAHLVRFSIQHSITTANAYSTTFVLMAFAQANSLSPAF